MISLTAAKLARSVRKMLSLTTSCRLPPAASAEAAGGSLQDVVKLSIFLTDLANFAAVNEIMARYFEQPYPARAAVGVAALPRNSQVEMDGVMHIG